MRFITEFEIHMQATEDVREFRIERARGEIGLMISDTFSWEIRQQMVTTDVYKLEIEAFLMDKWIEFKGKLMAHLTMCPEDLTGVLQLIKELEFHSIENKKPG